MLQNSQLHEMADLINHVVMPDASRSKSAALMRQQECFAIRKGIDGDLDAVRVVYMDAIRDLYDLTERYKEECQCLLWCLFVVYPLVLVLVLVPLLTVLSRLSLQGRAPCCGCTTPRHVATTSCCRAQPLPPPCACKS